MKKLFIILIMIMPIFMMGQPIIPENDVDPDLGSRDASSRSTATVIWTLDVETITGDNRCLGCEFDGIIGCPIMNMGIIIMRMINNFFIVIGFRCLTRFFLMVL